MFSLDALFCHVDDFCQQFVPQWQKTLLGHGLTHRQRAKSLCLSEIMTILIAFHANQYRNFKSYYLEQVTQQWGQAFPKLPSYQRLIEWIPSTLLPFCVYLKHCCGQCTGISFVDSTALKVCHNRRIWRSKFAIIGGFCGIKSLKISPKEGRLLWIGFSDLSFI